eukprot:scaffold118072_cov58-Attheya_sp.AAC.2
MSGVQASQVASRGRPVRYPPALFPTLGDGQSGGSSCGSNAGRVAGCRHNASQLATINSNRRSKNLIQSSIVSWLQREARY